MDNKTRMIALLNKLAKQGFFSQSIANILAESLYPSQENIEYLFDLVMGDYETRDSAIALLLKLAI